MWQYLVKRLLLLIVTLIGISVISFLLVTLAPGDPAATAQGLGPGGSGKNQRTIDEVLKHTRENLYLDRPVVLNFSPMKRSVHAQKLVKEICEGSDYARADAQGSITGGIGTAGLDVFVEEAQKRTDQATDLAGKLKAAVSALDTVAQNASAATADLDTAIKGITTLLPGHSLSHWNTGRKYHSGRGMNAVSEGLASGPSCTG